MNCTMAAWQDDITNYDALIKNFSVDQDTLMLNYAFSENDESKLRNVFVAVQKSNGKILWKSEPEQAKH